LAADRKERVNLSAVGGKVNRSNGAHWRIPPEGEESFVSMVYQEASRSAGAAPRTREDEAAADSFALRDLARVARARHRLIRNVTLGTLALVLLVLFLIPSSYSSSASVLLDPRKNNVTDMSAVLSDMPTDPSSVQNQIQVLTSRDLAAQVIDRLDLMDDTEFNPPPSAIPLNPMEWSKLDDTQGPDAEARRFNAVVDRFLKHLTVEAVGLSTTIDVTFSTHDPDKSARIANAIVDAYVEGQLNAKYEATHRTTEWLAQRIRLLAQQVQADESAVQRYKAENGLTDAADGTPLVDQQVGGISTQLVQARADLAAKVANYNRIQSLMQSGHVADVSQIVSSPLIVQLREQQAEVIRDQAQLATRYGPKNPKLIASQSQQRDLDAKIAQEVDRLAGSAENDVSVARAQVASLESSLRQTEHQSTSQDFARVKLKALEANAVSTRSMYEAFVTRLREAQDQDGVQAPDAHVISHASVPTKPSSPPRLLISLAALPASLLLGLLAALLAERMNLPVARMRARAPRAADPLHGIRVVAQMPNALAMYAADRVADQPMSPYGLEMRALAARIAQAGYGTAPKVIAVTSAEPQEGKTTIAVALARAASQNGQRVVVIDGNLLAPAAGRLAGLGAPQAGLLEALRGSVPLANALARDTRSAAFVLSPSERYPDPRRVWTSAEMGRLVGHLRQNCDLVIVDSPPIFAAEMPAVIGLADAVLVVARWNGAPRPPLSQALQALSAAKYPPAALVLTS
jgi:polysaccharide biosynthesis transport protein